MIRRFALVRDVDHTGLSGTGVVADGVLWQEDGSVTVRWRELDAESPNYLRGVRSTKVEFPNLRAVEALHGHNGATRIFWVDEEP